MRRPAPWIRRSTGRDADRDPSARGSLRSALARAERRRDLATLAKLVRRGDPQQRREILRTALRIADELDPDFSRLLSAFGPEERALVIGVRLEASRLDPNRERRLARLRSLARALPEEQRALYWPEAQALAERGGDDARLALFGIARDLPSGLSPLTIGPLRRGAGRMRDAFKRAAAYRALADLTRLTDAEREDARHSAARVPDGTLREIAASRFPRSPADAPGDAPRPPGSDAAGDEDAGDDT